MSNLVWKNILNKLRELNKNSRVLEKPQVRQSNGFQKFAHLKVTSDLTKNYVRLFKDNNTLQESDVSLWKIFTILIRKIKMYPNH